MRDSGANDAILTTKGAPVRIVRGQNEMKEERQTTYTLEFRRMPWEGWAIGHIADELAALGKMESWCRAEGYRYRLTRIEKRRKAGEAWETQKAERLKQGDAIRADVRRIVAERQMELAL